MSLGTDGLGFINDINAYTPEPSDGVGILIQKWLIDHFEITVTDKTYDDTLGIKFRNHNSDFEFIVFSCYFLPEHSS